MSITAAADFERTNEFLTQRIGPAMDRFANRYQLTLRESEILVLIAGYGLSNGEIAERCVISEKTVKNHLANIMKKIGIRSTRKLLAMVLNHVLYDDDNSFEAFVFEEET